MSSLWDVLVNNGYTYEAAYWASVKDDLRVADNWTFYDEYTVLKEHKAP